MPHLILEYTHDLVAGNPMAETLDDINASLIASGAILKESDLKSRIVVHDRVRVGTGRGARGFVHAQLRLLPGRTPEVRADLSQRIAAVLRARCPRPEGTLVQLSVEVVEMDRASYVKEAL